MRFYLNVHLVLMHLFLLLFLLLLRLLLALQLVLRIRRSLIVLRTQILVILVFYLSFGNVEEYFHYIFPATILLEEIS